VRHYLELKADLHHTWAFEMWVRPKTPVAFFSGSNFSLTTEAASQKLHLDVVGGEATITGQTTLNDAWQYIAVSIYYVDETKGFVSHDGAASNGPAPVISSVGPFEWTGLPADSPTHFRIGTDGQLSVFYEGFIWSFCLTNGLK
jgi:hypothetical protein